LEGTDGAGKTTVAAGLASRLQSAGRNVVLTRQPGGTSLGAMIRRTLLHEQEVEPLAELFLFLADRAQHVREVLRPALESGHVVVCDRYVDSTVVYQGYARGLDLDQVRSLNHIATCGLQPGLTLLLDLDPAVGLKRVATPDLFDGLDRDFHAKVRAGFLAESALEPKRWRVVDASGSPAEVLDRAWAAVRVALGVA
jgi:dTMP kinase